jgi:hypothetical protein
MENMKITCDLAPFSALHPWLKRFFSILLPLTTVLPFSVFATDQSPFELCPTEIKRHILYFLDVDDLRQAAQTSRQNRDLAIDLFNDQEYLKQNIRVTYLKHFRRDTTKDDLLKAVIASLVQKSLNTLNPELLYVIGYSYSHEIGVKGNPKMALIYYDAASEQGHPEALKSSINYHQNGYAGTPDMAKANKFKEKLPRQRNGILTYIQDMVTCFCLPFYLQQVQIHQK